MQEYLSIQFFSVGSADAMAIRFLGEDQIFHNILIDAGKADTYKTTIRKELLAIQSRNEKVDLWCITHTDNDHINGIHSFLEDRVFKNKPDFINTYWFNWSDYPMPNNSSAMSVRKGMRLRDYLIEIGKAEDKDILALQVFSFLGAKITMLSPNPEKLEDSKIAWRREESKFKLSSSSDYHRTIENLLGQEFEEDNAPFNGGSIAFLFEYADKKLLFLADSHPSVIEASLRQLGFSESNKLKVDWVKVAHHGSKKNTSPHFLKLIDCPNFLFSANGVKHKLTLARILQSRDKLPTHFWFTNKTPAMDRLFTADGIDVYEKYKFECHFPTAHANAICITF